MPYLIDGNNLGGAMAGPAGARDRDRVVRWVLEWCRGGRRAVVVFDGAPDETAPTAYGDVGVRFAGSRSADAAIREAVARDPGAWIVVTDDAALRTACRETGARVASARELLVSVSPGAEGTPEKPRGPIDVEDWLAFFDENHGD